MFPRDRLEARSYRAVGRDAARHHEAADRRSALLRRVLSQPLKRPTGALLEEADGDTLCGWRKGVVSVDKLCGGGLFLNRDLK